MTEQDRMMLQQLINKVNQHEETIVQLMKIIAATNQRISNQLSDFKEAEQFYTKV
ncbi:hypothetical protein [Oceanobacillus zhaokaii]|uniref:hypothetical protein n=1 Tax=Oceanobacillus zhaokaii TaxID=2052660 RepID=UPI0013B35DCE|nr:hypothetical protein [Oceanobacillus zhaokaii]